MYDNVWGGNPSPYVYPVHVRGEKEVDAGSNGMQLFILKLRWEIQHPKMSTITPQPNSTHPHADEEDTGGWGGYRGSGASLWGWVRPLRRCVINNLFWINRKSQAGWSST